MNSENIEAFKQIQEYIEMGFSPSRVSKMPEIIDLDISRKEITKFVEDNKITIKKDYFNDSKIKQICELYKMGISAKQLGFKYGIDKRRVQKWVKEIGELRSFEDSRRFIFFNEHKMDIIDSPDKAYWLGFFYAGSYNYEMGGRFSLALKGDDFELINKCARFFEFPEKLTKTYTTNNGAYISKICLYNQHLCNKLAELGCPQAKSFIVKYPKWLNKDFDNHFIRGLFDGDGCLTFRKKQREWKWSLAGTEEICDGVIEKFSEVGIIMPPKASRNISKTNNNTFELSKAGNESILKICEYLYKDANKETYLDRKYDKYLQLKEQQNNRLDRYKK